MLRLTGHCRLGAPGAGGTSPLRYAVQATISAVSMRHSSVLFGRSRHTCMTTSSARGRDRTGSATTISLTSSLATCRLMGLSPGVAVCRCTEAHGAGQCRGCLQREGLNSSPDSVCSGDGVAVGFDMLLRQAELVGICSREEQGGQEYVGRTHASSPTADADGSECARIDSHGQHLLVISCHAEGPACGSEVRAFRMVHAHCTAISTTSTVLRMSLGVSCRTPELG